MCSVVNRVMSVPSRYFWTARTVSPACRGQRGGERLSGWSRETDEKMFDVLRGEKNESIVERPRKVDFH